MAENRLASGTAWLAGVMQTHAGHLCRYHRKGHEPWPFVATLGESEWTTIDAADMPVEKRTIDFLVPAGDLRLGELAAKRTEPMKGDQITVVIGDMLQAYNVAPGPNGLSWEYTNPSREQIRIHTIYVGESRTEWPA